MTAKKKTPSKGKAKPKKAGKKDAPAKKTPAKKAARKPVKKAPAPKKTAKKQTPELHWLMRPETIRKLWFGGGAVLAVLVVLQAGIETHGYFGLDGTFGFNAWYGFIACVAMIIVAKGLGAFLKREDTYYGGD